MKCLSPDRIGDKMGRRFAPDLKPNAARDSVVVIESPATFKVGDRTIAIPGGKVFKPDQELSEAGFWVIALASTGAA